MDTKITSPQSPRNSIFPHAEVESSNVVIMLVMVIGAINLEEELANMKAALERFSKGSEEKDVQIKRQNKHIVDLTKKLGKLSSKASNNGSNDTNSNKNSHQRI